MKWINQETGEVSVSMQEVHDMLTTRKFSHEGTNFGHIDIEPAIPEVQPQLHGDLTELLNHFLEALNDMDCTFHDLFEDAYCSSDPGDGSNEFPVGDPRAESNNNISTEEAEWNEADDKFGSKNP